MILFVLMINICSPGPACRWAEIPPPVLTEKECDEIGKHLASTDGTIAAYQCVAKVRHVSRD